MRATVLPNTLGRQNHFLMDWDAEAIRLVRLDPVAAGPFPAPGLAATDPRRLARLPGTERLPLSAETAGRRPGVPLRVRN